MTNASKKTAKKSPIDNLVAEVQAAGIDLPPS